MRRLRLASLILVIFFTAVGRDGSEMPVQARQDKEAGAGQPEGDLGVRPDCCLRFYVRVVLVFEEEGAVDEADDGGDDGAVWGMC